MAAGLAALAAMEPALAPPPPPAAHPAARPLPQDLFAGIEYIKSKNAGYRLHHAGFLYAQRYAAGNGSVTWICDKGRTSDVRRSAKFNTLDKESPIPEILRKAEKQNASNFRNCAVKSQSDFNARKTLEITQA